MGEQATSTELATVPTMPVAMAPGGDPFDGMLSALDAADETLVTDFDPALVGDVRDKVDSLEFIDSRYKAFDAFMEALIEPLMQRKHAAQRNHKRMMAYIAAQMIEHKFEEVPGNVHRIALQDNSTASLILDRDEPNETDAALFPEYVREVHYFEWDAPKIKADLLDGTLKTCPFAKVQRGKHARFYFRKADKLPPKKKGKKA